MKLLLSNCGGAVLSLLGLLVTLYVPADAIPAYSSSNYNTLDYSQDYYHQPTAPPTPPTTQPPRRASNGGRRTLQSVVRHHMEELDKQTQNDLKILSYLETELNQIFSCYIRLSCPRTRSAKVLAECDEIKDWPLYHQVMKMAGIRRYPYQNYAPQPQPRQVPSTTTTTPAPLLEHSYIRTGRHERVSGLLPANVITNEDFNSARDADVDEEMYYQQRDSRHRPRRIRYGQNPKQSVAENEIGNDE
ncbi:hypothetical protein Ocin01_03554 [Orchesella cincta]|uniref:Uncharacterized protein n=1 Tax=Orchesella cincta TaxID=48709 RepID=A0A1D2ND13_ORCCI|nr:hypothetical protein Ocin01_03554 [Orchesella cincta]